MSHVFTHLEFPGDRQAFVEASFMMQGNPIDVFFRVLGSQRSIEYTFSPDAFALHDVDTHKPSPTGASLLLYEWKQEPRALYTPQSDSFGVAMRDQLDYFAECVGAGQPPRIGAGAQARQSLENSLGVRTFMRDGEAGGLEFSPSVTWDRVS